MQSADNAMGNWTIQKGFSFLEMVIAVGLVGMLSAAAIPSYRGYVDTANMIKVTASFEESIRLVANTFARRRTNLARGIIVDLPDSTESWIAVLNPQNKSAPGGGPAFIPSTDISRGDEIKGAIGVQWLPGGGGGGGTQPRLKIWRPLYKTLEGQEVTITEDDTQIATFE
jgi:prepilin-type N-terminal cleavage/methylation domain-containing protein